MRFIRRMSTAAPCAPSVRQAMGSLCAGTCLSADPLLLDTPTLANEVRIQKRAGCRCRHGLMAASQLSWYMQASHLDMPPDNNVALRKAPRFTSVRTARTRSQAKTAWCATFQARHSEARGVRVMHDTCATRSIRISPKSAWVRDMRDLLHPMGWADAVQMPAA